MGRKKMKVKLFKIKDKSQKIKVLVKQDKRKKIKGKRKGHRA
jgi:hypothetical protein